MCKAIFTESIEIGNSKTGYYRKWEKKAEFEGTAGEVVQLINNASSRLKLPGVSSRWSKTDNIMIDSFPKLLKLDE